MHSAGYAPAVPVPRGGPRTEPRGACSPPGELQADDPVVLRVTYPLDQLGRDGPVDQPDGTVMAQQQVVGDLADRGPTVIGVPPDGQQELVLCRGQPGALRLLLTPAHETPQARSQRQQILIVGISQNHRVTITSYSDGYDGCRSARMSRP